MTAAGIGVCNSIRGRFACDIWCGRVKYHWRAGGHWCGVIIDVLCAIDEVGAVADALAEQGRPPSSPGSGERAQARGPDRAQCSKDQGKRAQARGPR